MSAIDIKSETLTTRDHNGGKYLFTLSDDHLQIRYNRVVTGVGRSDGEQTIPLHSLKPDPSLGTIRTQRTFLVLCAIMAMMVPMGIMSRSPRTLPPSVYYYPLLIGGILLVLGLLIWGRKTVSYRCYFYTSGVAAFNIFRDGGAADKHQVFCERLEEAIRQATKLPQIVLAPGQ